MKQLSKLMMAAALAILSLTLIVPTQAQVTPTSWTTLTGIPAKVVGGTTSNITSTAVDVRQGKGMAVFFYYGSTNGAVGTGAVTLTFGVTYDGTNYSDNSGGLTFAPLLNAATGRRAYTNFPATLLGNVQKIKLLSIANANDETNTVYLTNVVLSVSN